MLGPSADAFTRLDDNSVAESLFGPQFTHQVMHGPTGDIWAAWQNNTAGPNSGTFMFRRSTNKWQKVCFTDDINHNVSNRENFGSCYDYDHDVMWIGNNAPNSQWTGECSFDTKSNTYNNQNVYNVAPFFDNFHTNTIQVSRAFCAWEYYNGALYTIMSPDQSTKLTKMVLPYQAGNFTEIGGSTGIPWSDPNVYQAGQWRSGIDHRTGQVWLFANGNELYMYDLNGGTNYFHVPTFGIKPPINCNFGLHEKLNTIIAWCGQDSPSGGGGGATYRTVYKLNLGTLTWALGPSLAGGDTVPGASVPPGATLMYDTLNKCMVLFAYDGSVCEVWRLDIADTTL